MAITRKIKVDLSQFDEGWEDSYIVVGTNGFQDRMEQLKRNSKMEREMSRLTRKVQALTRRHENGEDVLDELDKLEGEQIKLSFKAIDEMQKYFKQRFVEGKIVEDNKLRDMTKDDVLALDEEVLKSISDKAFGNVEKKG